MFDAGKFMGQSHIDGFKKSYPVFTLIGHFFDPRVGGYLYFDFV